MDAVLSDESEKSGTTSATLDSLCAANHPCEVVRRSDETSVPPGKARFLDLADDTLVIDHPTTSGKRLSVSEGEEIEVFFNRDGACWGFSSRVRKRSGQLVCGSNVVQTLELSRPDQIRRIQRRECYRVHFYPALRPNLRIIGEEADQEPLDGTLLDLSESGCAVILPEETRALLSVGEYYEVRFELGGELGEYSIVGQVRRIEDPATSGGIVVGVAWQLDESFVESRKVRMRLAQFIAAEQRRRMRRGR